MKIKHNTFFPFFFQFLHHDTQEVSQRPTEIKHKTHVQATCVEIQDLSIRGLTPLGKNPSAAVYIIYIYNSLPSIEVAKVVYIINAAVYIIYIYNSLPSIEVAKVTGRKEALMRKNKENKIHNNNRMRTRQSTLTRAACLFVIITCLCFFTFPPLITTTTEEHDRALRPGRLRNRPTR
jgi:CRISPR/Cas system-associated protein Csx1